MADTLILVVMLLVLFGLVAVVGLSVARSRARRRAEEADRIAAVRRTAEEDVIRLGEDIASLDLDLTGRPLDEATRQDYQRALDEYEHAKAALDAIRAPEDVRGVTQALEDGRYAMACVRARLDGRPLPTRRPPCFFNPQHGPSVEDVDWAPPGGAPRQVPVCAADAQRVRAGAEPDMRRVLVGGQRRPYWEAGPAYAPYAQGYFSPFAMSGLLPGILMGAVLTGGFGGWGDGDYGAGYDAGYDAGMDQGMDQGADAGMDDAGGDGDLADVGGDPFGGFDGGGFDGGGFDGGGFGDFGGGDFGGGDF